MNKISKFQDEVSQLISLENGSKIGVALSGGSDSLALCILLHQWLKEVNGVLIAITIDHQLRPESSKEALTVKSLLKNYGITHHIIPWLGPKPSSNLQEEARLARYKLLTDYCHQNNITYLFTGHQQNDQAENFIIRADHGTGVYGLAGIPSVTEFNKIKIIRPLLNFNKEELQNFLNEQNIEWIEDPSNQNERFARVKARNFLKQHPKWIVKLAALSKNLTRAKDAIEYLLNQSMDEIVTFKDKSASIELEKFNQLPQEIRFRMIAQILQTISAKEKPARAERIENLLAKIKMGSEFKTSTLSECLIKHKKNQLIITPEY